MGEVLWPWRWMDVTQQWGVMQNMIISLHVLTTLLMPPKAVWKALGVSIENWCGLDITWSDA